MKIGKNAILSTINNWTIFLVLSVILLGLILGSSIMIDYLRKEEINRIQIFATAQKFLNDEYMGDPRVQELILNIVQDNNSIPVIVTDRFNNPLFTRNLSPELEADPVLMKETLQQMEKKYKPVEIILPSGQNQYLYYSNSKLLDQLRYYPYLLAILVLGYFLFSFWFLKTIKKTDEGFLWAGLAKETAHQIGTPLSSMIGWLEILKLEKYSDGLHEMEKDITRLTTITERFSKIGSTPELKDKDLTLTIQNNYDYLKSRISKKVNFTLMLPSEDIRVLHSNILMSWVIENLVKNAVDAMKGVGELSIVCHFFKNSIYIDVTDNGVGMTSAQTRQVFKAGYSTKKRGWGLGLSLSKRVVNDYHNGELKVHNSEIGKGTCFRIILPNKS